VILNDFGASVPLGTIIGSHFITTHKFMSPRVQYAKYVANNVPNCKFETRYGRVDDYAALFFVLLEFCQPGSSVLERLSFFQSELEHDLFTAFDAFALFLCEFHAALRPVMTVFRKPVPADDEALFFSWAGQIMESCQTPQMLFDYYGNLLKTAAASH
jgi:hypothetical protein